MRRLATEEQFLYLPVSRRDRLWDLYVTGTGHIVHALPNDPNESHPLPYFYHWKDGRVLSEFGVFYVTQGQAEFESEVTGVKTAEAGNVILVFPGVWHRYRPRPDTGWTVYWTHFGGAWAKRLMRRGLISPNNPILETGIHDAILRSYLTLHEYIDAEKPGLQQLAASNVLQALGSSLATARTREKSGTYDAVVRQAKAEIDQRVDELINLKELAQSLGLSYNYFRRIFREQTGMAPYQYHLQLRINRAKALLQGTNLSATDIAYALHFDNLYHFSRTFKQKTGMTPTEWRRGTPPETRD